MGLGLNTFAFVVGMLILVSEKTHKIRCLFIQINAYLFRYTSQTLGCRICFQEKQSNKAIIPEISNKQSNDQAHNSVMIRPEHSGMKDWRLVKF